MSHTSDVDIDSRHEQAGTQMSALEIDMYWVKYRYFDKTINLIKDKRRKLQRWVQVIAGNSKYV